MLARATEVGHPLGMAFKTPLLVPSFSSKGFGTDSRSSEIQGIFNVAKEILTDSMLVSAYDIHHGNLELPANEITAIAFVDSGGYETSDHQDLSSPFSYRAESGAWTHNLYLETVAKWPAAIPAIIVSFDDSKAQLSIDAQVRRATEDAERIPRQLHAFLAKPEPNEAFVDVAAIIAHAKKLRRFAVLGVTEKEIGNSSLQRMQSLARLRLGLDQQNLRSLPIHVFGSLDPISVCLYFVAGAEIFDGLTWLRYVYAMDTAMYRQNGAVLADILSWNDAKVRTWAMSQNIAHLDSLRNKMRRFLNDGDYSVFPRKGDWLQKSMELLRSEFQGMVL